MLDRAQLLKGVLDGCILEVISKEETYGYKITEYLNQNGFPELNEGSVYPVLIRLEKKGLIDSILKKSPLGPKRKYFKITNNGEQYLHEFIEVWDLLEKSVKEVFKGGMNHD
jgi:PadR family transcriptional regulator PadR